MANIKITPATTAQDIHPHPFFGCSGSFMSVLHHGSPAFGKALKPGSSRARLSPMVSSPSTRPPARGSRPWGAQVVHRRASRARCAATMACAECFAEHEDGVAGIPASCVQEPVPGQAGDFFADEAWRRSRHVCRCRRAPHRHHSCVASSTWTAGDRLMCRDDA